MTKKEHPKSTIYVAEATGEEVDVAIAYPRCLFINTVKTARRMTRTFDQKLAPWGVTSIQYFVMMFVRHNEGKTINAIAEMMEMDRSTLTRNIDGLVRKGLVVKQMAPKGNAKICQLTPKGDELLEELIPQWLDIRSTLQIHLADKDIDGYRATLQALAEI